MLAVHRCAGGDSPSPTSNGISRGIDAGWNGRNFRDAGALGYKSMAGTLAAPPLRKPAVNSIAYTNPNDYSVFFHTDFSLKSHRHRIGALPGYPMVPPARLRGSYVATIPQAFRPRQLLYAKAGRRRRVLDEGAQDINPKRRCGHQRVRRLAPKFRTKAPTMSSSNPDDDRWSTAISI